MTETANASGPSTLAEVKERLEEFALDFFDINPLVSTTDLARETDVNEGLFVALATQHNVPSTVRGKAFYLGLDDVTEVIERWAVVENVINTTDDPEKRRFTALVHGLLSS